MQKCNFLIVTASIGSGHMKAAAAICEEIEKEYPQAKLQVVDFMSAEISWLNEIVKRVYLQMLRFLPNLYEFLYRFTAQGKGFTGQTLMSVVMEHNMKRLIKKYQPDVIICTHPFPVGATSYLREKEKTNFLFAAVLTDYSLHSMWLYKNVDLYFVATEEMKNDLAQIGFPAERIHVVGIPIAAKFVPAAAAPALYQKYNLRSDAPVILLMGGGLGLGAVSYTLEQLEKIAVKLQLVVIAGKNERLFADARQYAAKSHHDVQVFGFVDDVQDLMKIADFLISKPGALTISEAMAMGLPMILHEPIPGPETDNAAYIAGKGAAIWVKKPAELLAAIESVLADKERLQDIRKAQEHCGSRQAAAKIIGILRQEFKKEQ